MPTLDPKLSKELADIEDAQALIRGRRTRGAGGTPGGVGTFLLGVALSVLGGYLVLNQVQVTSAFAFFGNWGIGRPAGFGLTLLPLLIGIGVLFFDGKSKLGWFLSVGGLLTIVAAVLMSLSIHWAQTSLFNTLLMFGLLAAGFGLVARSLRAYPDPGDP
ncbi:MAG TPA: hypothetical protein VIR81_08665 [Myxococcales bacterium]|nr:hypothetical protein [Myxococcales bacterium]